MPILDRNEVDLLVEAERLGCSRVAIGLSCSQCKHWRLEDYTKAPKENSGWEDTGREAVARIGVTNVREREARAAWKAHARVSASVGGDGWRLRYAGSGAVVYRSLHVIGLGTCDISPV